MIKLFDIYVIGMASAFGICTMLLYGMITTPHVFGNITQMILGFFIGMYMLAFIMRMEQDNVSSDNRMTRLA
jgi:uncharacterized membrane protein AbrB (regulator of aidB expression)